MSRVTNVKQFEHTLQQELRIMSFTDGQQRFPEGGENLQMAYLKKTLDSFRGEVQERKIVESVFSENQEGFREQQHWGKAS